MRCHQYGGELLLRPYGAAARVGNRLRDRLSEVFAAPENQRPIAGLHRTHQTLPVTIDAEPHIAVERGRLRQRQVISHISPRLPKTA